MPSQVRLVIFFLISGVGGSVSGPLRLRKSLQDEQQQQQGGQHTRVWSRTGV